MGIFQAMVKKQKGCSRALLQRCMNGIAKIFSSIGISLLKASAGIKEMTNIRFALILVLQAQNKRIDVYIRMSDICPLSRTNTRAKNLI